MIENNPGETHDAVLFENKSLITLCVVLLALFYFSHVFFNFSRIFLAFFSRFLLAFLIPTCWYPKREEKRKKNAREMQENIANQRETREFFYILHYVFGKNASQLRFFSRFGMFEVTKTQTQRKV